MNKYIGKNRKKNDCAIVSVFNALTWLKNPCDYEMLEFIAKEGYYYDPKEGFDCRSIDSFIKNMVQDVEFLKDYTVQQAETKILEGNGAIAALFNINDEEGHMVFLKPHGQSIKVLNSDKKWIDIVLGFVRKEIRLSVWSVGKGAA